MEAVDLFKELNRLGISVTPEGENLRIKGRLTPEMRKMLKVLKIQVLEALSILPPGEYPTVSDLAEFRDNPAMADAFTRLSAESRQMRAGIVPERYTSTVTCRNCGPVPHPPWPNKHANNCPWCFVGGYGTSSKPEEDHSSACPK